ncbi:AAA family ATPase [Brevundimonas subvibrioides]|uniref:AAA family ATPase n=1 Tax=Brevundimonas subvibrioides TaxID=74313 RepID=UPI0022B49C34|nr:AAA family ATPase [Brevundimonas subvibrioides]
MSAYPAADDHPEKLSDCRTDAEVEAWWDAQTTTTRPGIPDVMSAEDWGVDLDGTTADDLDRPLGQFVRPFVWRDPATMPRRQWVYGRHLIRRFVSATFAPGGVGKSALVLSEAMAMASGKPVLGIRPRERLRVGYWNGEDPFEETERRALAASLLHDLYRDDLEGWLHLGSGREDEVIIAEQGPSGATILGPNVEAVLDTIRTLRLDVVIIDPFVSSHRVTENDNNAIDLVAKRWGKIADVTNTAIELVHHTRKTNGAETTVEDGRGAVSLLNAARSARVLNAMSKEERERAGVKPGEAYFRVENGKANLAPPAEGADWFQVASVDLGNGDDYEPSDNVGAVRTWQWPDAFDGVTAADLLAVQRAIDGGQWRENSQANEWAGRAVADTLGLNLDDAGDKSKVKSLLARWLKEGALNRVMAPDKTRQERPMIEVGKWAETA